MAELEFDPPGREQLEFDGPQSGGAFAAKELAPGQAEQGERRRKLMQLIEAKGEPGYGARLKDNFTLGLNRPLGGVASVLGGGSWKAGVGAEEDYIKRAEANTNPYVGAAADVLGGLASGGPASSLVKGAGTVVQQAPSKAAKVAQWLVGSTGSGAIEGAARGSESAENAAIGAGVGAAAGKVNFECRRGPDGSSGLEGRQGNHRRQPGRLGEDPRGRRRQDLRQARRKRVSDSRTPRSWRRTWRTGSRRVSTRRYTTNWSR